MFKLFRKKKHFFDEWEKSVESLSPFIPESGSIGSVKLGDRIESIQPLGKPIEFYQVEKNQYTLEYSHLFFNCKDEIITYIGCIFGGCDVKTAGDRPLTAGMTVEQVEDCLGPPDQDDREDVDDIVLSYTKGDIFLECEFGSAQELKRVNCFKREDD